MLILQPHLPSHVVRPQYQWSDSHSQNGPQPSAVYHRTTSVEAEHKDNHSGNAGERGSATAPHLS